MAPRRKSAGTLRGLTNSIVDKENSYLRSLSDYQARVRRRESIRNCKNVAEYDLERKIELEIKMKEGSSRLLAASRHPTQSLEAARALLTSTERMSAYMDELRHRKDCVPPPSALSITKSSGKLCISDLRFPLMWKDSDHFKNRGDYRRFAVFCLARIGTEIHDTSLICPVDREQTDISFPDTLLFNNVPAEFELILEIYSHILQQDLSIASTPRRIRKTIHSSISKTVGRKLTASLRDAVYDANKVGPQFDLIARARVTLDEADENIRTHDLQLNTVANKFHVLPLFDHFCCRLTVQPDCIHEEVCSGFVTINNQRYWARLQAFRIEAWNSVAEKLCEPVYTIYLNKDSSVKRLELATNKLQLDNCVDGTEKCHVIELESDKDVEKWLEQLVAHLKEYSIWKHAAVNVQRIACSENSCIDVNERQGTLYDETPLIDTILPSSISGISAMKEALRSDCYDSSDNASSTAHLPSISTKSILGFKSQRQLSDTIYHR